MGEMMTKRRTEEEIKEIVEKLGYIFVEEYSKKSGKQNKRMVVFIDKFGFKYDGDFLNLKKGAVPRAVGVENRFVLENISLSLKLNNKSIELCENDVYKGNHKKLFFHCLTCDGIFDMSWHNISSQNQGCPYCSGRRVKKENSLFYLRKDLLNEWDYNKNKISPEEVACGSNKKVWWICSECDKRWEAAVYNRAIRGDGCKPCSSKKNGLNLRKSHDEYVKELHDKVEGEYSLLSEYAVSFNKVKMIHNICGHTWFVSPLAFLNNGTRCPKCKFSKGENVIETWLNKNNIFYCPQHKFPDCKNKRKLPFDFYLPEYNMVIEYDGIFHFEDKFSNPKEFKLIQKRDGIKTKYCKDNNINLLRIPYWNFDNIENILEKTLS